MRKKGWLRIVEAFISILIITGVVILIYSINRNYNERGEEIYELQQTILNEIASDPKLRIDVLNNNIQEIEKFVENRIPENFEFKIKICDINDICGLDFYKERVYSSERAISSTLTLYKPKKVKIFMWRE